MQNLTLKFNIYHLMNGKSGNIKKQTLKISVTRSISISKLLTKLLKQQAYFPYKFILYTHDIEQSTMKLISMVKEKVYCT